MAEFDDAFSEVHNGDLFVASEINDFPGGVFRLDDFCESLDNIVNGGKATRLFPGAVNDERLVIKSGGDKTG